MARAALSDRTILFTLNPRLLRTAAPAKPRPLMVGVASDDLKR
jgi:hypothetical protein